MKTDNRLWSGWLCRASISLLVLWSFRPARAGLLEVTASDATPAALAAAGFPGLNGNGIQVGEEEAGNGQPLTTNAFLPQAPAANAILVLGPQSAGQPAQVVTNHATEVAGQIVAIATTPGNNQGIAPGASLQSSGVVGGDNQVIQNNQALLLGTYVTPAGVAAKTRAHIVNMSFGNSAIASNGLSTRAEYLDWAALSTAVPSSVAPADNLFVVAGNEGAATVPSDAYNAINVAATGIRNGAGNLVYTQAASYNTTNITSDTRTLISTTLVPVTFGRIKTDIIAPGGDPGPGGGAGTYAAPPANVNQFITASGQRFERNGSDGAGNPRYDFDDFNGTGLTGTVGANATLNGRAIQDTMPFQPPPFPTSVTIAQAGGFFNPGDTVQATTLAGTSFAAPLVSGSAALLAQYGTNQGFSIDHRVIKALLLNGANKTAPGGGPLLDQNGNPWGKALDPFFAANNKLATEYPAQYGAAAGQIYAKADPFSLAIPAGSGVIPIKIGLDPQLGTGQLDVRRSLVNYAAGQQGPGVVNPTGWDLNSIEGHAPGETYMSPGGAERDYIFTVPGQGQLSATLTWDRLATLNDANGNGIWDPGETFNATNAAGATTGTGGQALTDLDLQLFILIGGGPGKIQLDFSTSDIDNVEHLFPQMLGGGNTYDLAVFDRTPGQGDTYGLAWSVTAPVPEPSALCLLVAGLPLFWLTRRRRGVRGHSP